MYVYCTDIQYDHFFQIHVSYVQIFNALDIDKIMYYYMYGVFEILELWNFELLNVEIVNVEFRDFKSMTFSLWIGDFKSNTF